MEIGKENIATYRWLNLHIQEYFTRDITKRISYLSNLDGLLALKITLLSTFNALK